VSVRRATVPFVMIELVWRGLSMATSRVVGRSWRCAAGFLALSGALTAQTIRVEAETKVSATAGGFGGQLDPHDRFGTALAVLGDLDGDGTTDLAVGAETDDDGGTVRGAVWILFLKPDGTVASEQKINAFHGGFGGALDFLDFFGCSLAALGDLDGDGTVELAVGATHDDDGGEDQGAVWILSLDPDGTVASERKISETAGGFEGALDSFDWFGCSVAALGDLDGDGTGDLAVGAFGDDDGDTSQGAVWILFLNPDGTVASERKISATAGGFGGDLDPFDDIGYSVAALGDLDGDGTGELAVGAFGDDDGSMNQGAVWILSLNPDGTVASEAKISATAGSFEGELHYGEEFGASLAALGDLDGDGVGELSIGSPDGDGDPFRGGVWILFLNPDGTVASEHQIGAALGGFEGYIDVFDHFGKAVAALGDLDGDGSGELAVGACFDSDDGVWQGSVWNLFLGEPPCFTLDFEGEDDFATPLVNGQGVSTPPEFGHLVRISCAGANAGAAIFDSTPGGPNEPPIHAGMLVGQGNVLLLQDDAHAFPQTTPGVFDVVTDDPDGGDLDFEFLLSVDPRSLLLAGIDPAPGQGASVTLRDEEGRTRIYTVQPGWTGAAGDAGPHRLDLVTLEPQLGNGTASLATAQETPGFEPQHVVRITVHLTGLGAIDELAFCAPRRARAAVRERNGSGLNPRILSSGSWPELGRTWNATLDCSSVGSGFAVLELRARATSHGFTPHGEVLVSGSLFDCLRRPYVGGPSVFDVSVPLELSLLGLDVHVQGSCRGAAAFVGKTRTAEGRLSNALDLVLGF
jgi:FG-GAP repeat protein